LGGSVVFHGSYPLEAMVDFYRLADIFLLTLQGGVIDATVPGKAQGYLSTGKPILAAINGAGREMMNEADCGEVVAAGDCVALAKKMIMMINNFEKYKENGLNGFNFYEAHYSKDRFFDSLIWILEANSSMLIGNPGAIKKEQL